jgi:TolB-like protein/DNA-binding winged helix-turn-helix (wHTH) protein
MPGPESTNGDVSFGVFELDLQARELRKKGRKVKLQQQPFEVLRILLERPGAVVSREELRQKMWPADVYVDFDRSLNKAIVKLRDALSDSADCPLYVETLPRIGYRFIGPINGARPPADQPAGEIPHSGASLPRAATASLDTRDMTRGPQTPTAGEVSKWQRHSRLILMIGIAAVLIGGIATTWLVRKQKRAFGPIHSLAVLPLENLSGAADEEYFADALTGALTTDLGKMSALRVISRTSVMQYKGSRKPVPEIAKDLNVDALIEGTLVRSGSHVRINVNLIQASPEKQIWAESYESGVADAFSVQANIAQAIAREIQVNLTPREKTLIASRRSADPVAQDFYLRGAYIRNTTQSAASSEQAIMYFQKAVAKDPNFAPAYAGLAGVYALFIPGMSSRPRDLMPRAKEFAQKAVRLDETLPDGHSMLGNIELLYDWDWSAAEGEFKRTMALNPNDRWAHEWHSRGLVTSGRTEEATAEAQ